MLVTKNTGAPHSAELRSITPFASNELISFPRFAVSKGLSRYEGPVNGLASCFNLIR